MRLTTINRWKLERRPSFALAFSVGGILPIVWSMVVVALMADDKTSITMRTSNDSKCCTDTPQKLRIVSSHYDERSALLSLKVECWNSGNQPMYLVAHDFSFVEGHEALGHWLQRYESDDELILDLSYTPLTADGYRFYRGELGSYGPLPQVIEIAPKDFRYITYVFQFPLRLDFRIADKDRRSIPLPQGKQKVSLRFGYGRESYDVFDKREFAKKKYAIEEWRQHIIKEWQRYVETEPVSIQFSK